MNLSDRDLDPLLAAYLASREVMIRYFTVRMRSAEAAEDLVQEIYLKIIRRPQGETIENPTAYLYRLGSNLMLDRLKHERRVSQRSAAWAELQSSRGGEFESDEPTADQIVLGRESLQRAIEAVRGLPPNLQQAFRLHKLEGLSHAETAAAMGVSRSTIEKYIMTCLKRILTKIDT